MKKMCIAYLGVLLLALHLSSQVVRAQTDAVTTADATVSSSTMSVNSTNATSVSPDNGSGSTASCTLLLPLALSASLLHDWS